jgi:uncharacterized cupin superfamily protein
VGALNVFEDDAGGGRIDGSTKATAVYVYDLEPGASSSPYHYEYVEEWLLVVDGTVVVRVPNGERTLRRGDLMCFPAGPEGAHKTMNRSDARARIMMFSQAASPAVSVYPDSDKIAVWPGHDADAGIFRRGSAVPWSDGEEGWNRAD